MPVDPSWLIDCSSFWFHAGSRSSTCSGTWMPILLRYLKQSAIVLATLWTRMGSPSTFTLTTPCVGAWPENRANSNSRPSVAGFLALRSIATQIGPGAMSVQSLEGALRRFHSRRARGVRRDTWCEHGLQRQDLSRH